ncbi:MAG: hypothetical protein H6648_02670 [Caldilineae bacterium]|nr:hypothetical protein [Chloroflexota bacterium]MCB9176036.1 hypothetical protein [Caldilineae bacterium]
MPDLNALLETLRSVGGYVAVVAIVSLFLTLAAMLWSWRKVALDEDETG